MHGDISVDSTPGAGTSIVWTLKFRIDKDYHELPAAQEAEPLDLTGSKVLAATSARWTAPTHGASPSSP